MPNRGRNEGSVFKLPNGRWRAQISKNGQRLSFTGESKQACLAWLRESQHKVESGWKPETRSMLLKDYLTLWLSRSSLSLRPRTLELYTGLINKHILPQLGNLLLSKINIGTIESFYVSLRAAKIGVRTIRSCHSVLHRAFQKGLAYGVLLSNPCSGAELPRYQHREMQVLTESQISVFLHACQGSRFEALFSLAIMTGMRQAELFGLKWDDLDWQLGQIQVRRQVQRVTGKGWQFVEPKTRWGIRTIPLGKMTLVILQNHWRFVQDMKQYAGSTWQEYGLIFPTSAGTPQDSNNLRRAYYDLLQENQLPRLRFHDLRHTTASMLLNHGVPVIMVSRMLGHSKPSVTLDLYGHLYHEMQGSAIQVMDRLLNPLYGELNSSLFPNILVKSEE